MYIYIYIYIYTYIYNECLYTVNNPRGLYFSKALFEGFIFGGAYIRRGLSMEGNLCFKIDWASLTVKFTVFALFCFVFEGNIPSTSPRGAYIWRGDLTESFLRYRFGWVIFGGAYFRNLRYLIKTRLNFPSNFLDQNNPKSKYRCRNELIYIRDFEVVQKNR